MIEKKKLKYLGGIAKNRNILVENNSKKLEKLLSGS